MDSGIESDSYIHRNFLKLFSGILNFSLKVYFRLALKILQHAGIKTKTKTPVLAMNQLFISGIFRALLSFSEPNSSLWSLD